MPPCATFTGSLAVSNASGADLAGWDTVAGNLNVFHYRSSEDIKVRGDALRNISGRLLLGKHPSASSADGQGTVDLSFPALEYARELDVGTQFRGVSLAFGPNTTVDYVRMVGVKGLGARRYNTLYLNVTAVRGQLPAALRDGSEDPIRGNDAPDFYSTVVLLNASVYMSDNAFRTVRMPDVETSKSRPPSPAPLTAPSPR